MIDPIGTFNLDSPECAASVPPRNAWKANGCRLALYSWSLLTEITETLDTSLIASVSALSVAILTGISQAWQLRLQNRFSQGRDANTIATQLDSEELRAHQAAVRANCAALQAVLDELLLMRRATHHSLLSSFQRERLLSARDGLMRAYQEHHPVLAPNERAVLLVAREKTVDIVFMLDSASVWSNEYVQLAGEHIAALDRISIDLSSAHSQLLLGGLERLGQAFDLRQRVPPK